MTCQGSQSPPGGTENHRRTGTRHRTERNGTKCVTRTVRARSPSHCARWQRQRPRRRARRLTSATFSRREHSLRREEARGCRGGGSHVRRDHVVPRRCGRCIHGRPPAARRTHVSPRTVGRPSAAAKRHIHVRGTHERRAFGTRAGARRGGRASRRVESGPHQAPPAALAFTRSSVHARAPYEHRARRVRLSRGNYNRARVDRPRPLTLAVTLMSRQVTRAPHQVARSPPSAALPIKRRAQARNVVARSLSLSLSLPLTALRNRVCTRDYA